MKAADRVAGRYVLIDSLGKGGMGAVWRATDEVLKRTIALKEVQIPAALGGESGGDVNERVLREARAAARLSHPSATTVYDVFQEGGRTFIAMELVDAPTLGEIVEQNGPLEPDEVARIGLSLLDALDAAHSSGIVHRDVKPDNVMVTDNGRVKLADFGIASVKGDPRLTMSGIILGSPSYMAPEQVDGKRAEAEADLWSLGATLFYAVEGIPPFKKDSTIATLASVVGDPAPEPRRAAALGPVIQSLLTKDPARRPTSAALRRELELVAGGQGPAAIATEVVERSQPPTSSISPSVHTSEVARTAPAPRGKRSPFVLVGVVALLLIGVLAFAFLQGDDEPERATGVGSQTGASPGDGDEDAPVVSDKLVPYTIADTGYQISYPEGWEITENPPQITFSDPESSTSFLVEYTYSTGDDAVAAWEAQAEEFAASHEGYQEIAIEATTIEGFETSAIWEFTYEADGVTFHAIDIGMANNDIGFAHYFQTTEEEWESEQGTLDQIRASFAPVE